MILEGFVRPFLGRVVNGIFRCLCTSISLMNGYKLARILFTKFNVILKI